MTWQLCLKGQKERVACNRLKRIIDLKAEDEEMVHLGLFGYLVQTFLLFASWISPSNHFLRDVLTHKHPKRCFMSYIQHDGQCCILSVSFMQTMRSGLKLTNQQFSIVSSDHRNWVKMSKCLVVTAGLRRETSLPVFHVLWRKRTFWTCDTVLWNSIPEKYANIWQTGHAKIYSD